MATPVILSSTNTNNPNLPLTNSDGNTSNSLSAPTDTNWCTDGVPQCANKSMLAINNIANHDTMSSPNNDVYAYGNYYNWYSATAGNGTFEYFGDTEGDICPMGWRLPTGDISGEYGALNTAINQGRTDGDSGLRVFPANFVHSGNIDGYWGLFGRGENGFYWTSTSDGDSCAYFVQHSNDAFDSFPMSGTVGLSVRCLLRIN